MSRSSVAARVRLEKERHPERFCPNPTCLWRVQRLEHRPWAAGRMGRYKVAASPCPKHGLTNPPESAIVSDGGEA